MVDLHQGDCLSVLESVVPGSIDLAYIDPPFLTQKVHRLYTRDRTREFSFNDLWTSRNDYAEFLYHRLRQVYRVLSRTGSIFLHCDHNATHIARVLLDEILGPQSFRSEIIWYYRRWSNSRRGLVPAHQTIYYYTKSDSEYTFNTIWEDYSPSTNVDQILQRRARDGYNKVVYQRDEDGNTVPNGGKKGVRLGDVWDIPYLNPKARERTGYPTQKPLLLLERVIRLTTNEGDWVLDPFCGSGTALVASKLLGRNAIGIDISADAVEITRHRLQIPVKSGSKLLNQGRGSYRNADEDALSLLRGLDYSPVHRNGGIDAILKEDLRGTPIPIRVQREGETIVEAAHKLHHASNDKGALVMFLVAISQQDYLPLGDDLPPGVIVISAPVSSIRKHLDVLQNPSHQAAIALDAGAYAPTAAAGDVDGASFP